MADDQIAIVGAGCRFPGAENLDEYWRVLVNGENHVKDIPITRWNNDAFYDEDQTVPGKIYVKKAGLINNHDTWDNKLFGISDVEANRVDPQQRYVLECVHMALEDGGITRKEINGSKTGVIIGCMNDDYKVVANSDSTEVGSYTATGTSTSVISARVSYVYNLHGACLTLDTACSSALVAIHLASRFIRAGDCEMAICGGVSSILTPDIFAALCKARMMSKIGQCQSFCDTADGYARGEGCGIVILKSLKAAQRDGNKIWATVKTGCNQDGCAEKPMTAPSGKLQLHLLHHTYSAYDFKPSDIQYIEAHGTGTPRGDPTELNALGEFFSADEAKSESIITGSVKSNIGHTESAAGVAGLLKVLLMMANEQYVPSLHIKPDMSNLNKNIKLSEYNLEIATSVKEWPCNSNGARHAALNSFGFGGSNTHAIITQEQLSTDSVKQGDSDEKVFPICISGVDEDSLKLNLSQFQDDIEETSFSICDIANTSLNHRDIFQYRTLIFGNTNSNIKIECKKRIDAINKIVPKRKVKRVFVYCGVGTTWLGMCREFMQTNETFRNTIASIDFFLTPLTGWKIGDKFLSETDYEDPLLNHIAIFCVQVALTEVWKSFGIIPDAIIGQSVGEVAACYAANILSLKEAVQVIYHRSEILSRQTEGSMTVIGNVDIDTVEDVCKLHENKVCIAVYSSPKACTLSGNSKELKLITNKLLEDKSNENIFVRELKVKCAYHSPLLQPCLTDIEEVINKVFSGENTVKSLENSNMIQMISTVTGEQGIPEDMRTGEYWAKNVRQPVMFMQSIKAAFDDQSFNAYMEIGPRPVLQAHLDNILKDDSNLGRTLPSMKAKLELQCFYDSMARLFELGADMNLSILLDSRANQITTIPRYSFNRTGDLFIPKRVQANLAGFSKDSSSNHMYVQSIYQSAEPTFQITIDTKCTPFVYDHFLSERIVVPGATYVEAGFHIGVDMLKRPVDQLSVAFNFAKVFTPVAERQHQLDVDITTNQSDSIQFSVKNDANVLSIGTVSARKIPIRPLVDIQCLRAVCKEYKSKSECYEALKRFNFRYGDSLSLIQGSWVSESKSKCLAEINLPEGIGGELSKTHFHPAIIDALFQMFGIIAIESFETDMGMKNTFAVPKGVDAVVLNKPVEPVMYALAEEVKKTENSTHYNAILLSKNGTVIAEMENFYTRVISDIANLKEKTYGYGLNWVDISDMERTESFQHDNIALFSDGRNSSWLQELAKSVNEDILTEVKDEQLSHMLTLNGRTTIIYHVGSLDGSDENPERGGYTDEAVKRFFDLKKLMVSCKRFKASIRIFVITENTQDCPDRLATNCNGSELWGMLRSAVHEGFNENVFIVDVDGNDVDIQSLMSLLTYPYEGNTEYLLSGEKVFQPRLYTDQRTNKNIRKIVATPSDQLAICSSAEIEVTEPYLLLSQEKETMSSTLQITLESFTVHNKALYISTVGNSEMSDNFLQNRKDNNYQLIAVEGRGKIQHSNKNVIFLFPTRATTTVHIPKECIIETENPHICGTLILLNIAVHIMSSIKRGANVMVIKDNTNSDVGQKIFTKMLNKKGCKSQFCTFQELQNNPVGFLQDTIIMTTASVLGNWNFVKKSFPNLRKIMSISIFLQEKLRISLAHVFPGVQFTVLSISDILSINGIRSAMPTIKKYFQQFCSNTEPNETKSSFLLRLPMESVQVKEGIQDGSLQCYCDRKNMFQSKACYIVVGGLTGLGWELLIEMAKLGAGLLVTFSRRAPSDEINENIRNLQETYGCQIVSIQADITELASVQNAFASLRRQFPNFPIKGIFHGAGVLADSPLLNLTEETVKSVMIPKIQGAWNLHIASLDLHLDYFVMHSSIVSIIGNLGQCNYAAANSFLDSFASYRRSKGLPAQSINWGALAVGMAMESEKIKSQLQQKGFNSIGQDKIREIFLQTVLNDTTNTVYVDVEWKKLLAIPSFSLQVDKYSAFKIGKRALSSGKKIQIDLSVLRALPPQEQAAQVGAKVREIITDLVVIENDSLTNETPFTEIGIDSMAAMSLSNEIDDVFNCRIEMISLLSENTTISTVIETIVQSLSNTENETSETEEINITQEHIDMFMSDDLTFMQRDFIDNYSTQRNNPYFLLVIDIELMGVKFRLAKWKHVLNYVLRQHSELRKKYFFTEDGNVKIDSSAEVEVDVRKDSKINSKGKTGDVRKDMPPDIHNCLPISFRITQAKGSTILRIIAHKVAMDNKGFSLLLADIGKTCQAVGYKTPLPPIRQSVNVTSAVKESILPRMGKLANFWKKYLNHDIKAITLGTVLQEVEYAFCCQSLTNVPTVTAIAVRNYISKLGISLYDFFMSLYQLYLHVRTKEPIILVATAADMRFHVPVLSNVITRCTNYMPILAHINEESAIHTFIQGNSVQLSSTKLNGAYPSSLILQNIKSDEAREHAYRHCFVMHDMTEMSKLSETDNGRARLKNVWHSTPDRETFIYLHYNMKTGSIELETGYNSKICGHFGQTFAGDLLYLVNEAIENGDKSIKDIREELIQRENESMNMTPNNRTIKDDTSGKRYATNKRMLKGVPRDMFDKKSFRKSPDKDILKPQWIHFDSGKRITDYLKGHLTTKKEINSIENKAQHKTQNIIKSDPFEKQTTNGWDHTVQVSLCIGDGHRATLQWGKNGDNRETANRRFDITTATSVVMKKINGVPSLIVKSGNELVILKTQDRQQVDTWMDVIHEMITGMN